ncbi:hypothetical protein GIY23_18240 [Allosaccharopolyspora coralli]|uniref:Uncharacterized protein n=1 Tax=Allosaccharopolyspora coralli TaxID=2665642 RepID=A0A5Q3Q9Q3_9PSEU|nr:hypothetical protein [Allosaccharopolyspora coralli]QGK71202.1 hypothetical protein GIY23_18240 [Allosaccharopolyspora coralli]
MVQVQAANRHAIRKYEEFCKALDMVRQALDEAQPLIKTINGKATGRMDGWKIPSRQQVEKTYGKARTELDALNQAAKKYEKELISRGWRV